MKNTYKKIALSALAIFTLGSCDEQKLIDLNVNQNSPTSIDNRYILDYSILRVAGSRYESWRTNLIYSSTMVQHNASLQGYWSGDKYYYNPSYSAAYWESHYTNPIKNLTNIVDQTAGIPELANIHAAAQIMRAFDLHRMTDLYGDVPYTQAGRGLDGQENWFPAYDSQENIYQFLVADIKAARDEFSDSAESLQGSSNSQDVLFAGDNAKWKKFANSLLMRIAMRMSEVDPATAQSVFTEALSNGPIDGFDSNAFLKQALGNGGDTNYNGTSLVFSNAAGGGGDTNGRVSKTFLDWMNEHNDPRKMIIVGGVGNPYDTSTWNTDPEAQVGLPNGYTSVTIKDVNPDYSSVSEYSFVNPEILDLDDPTPFISHAEVELMKAEAVLKGWISGDAEEFFNAGVRAAMESWALFGVATPTAEEVDAYLVGLDFANAGNQMEMIGEQYWAATYLNHIEAWSNYRRSGYPALTPTSDPNNVTNGTIPKRLRYFEGEAGANPANYKAAVERQGPDLLTTPLWWDVKD
ncbi:SusD/RagB family nutrient-binding outer membrane lipoprotein [Jiulongibacter sp. NS-SX5]|uniref:SusD/RagB family nutrient-binding outer membrane lipoprotein n=1 Tax=Jiulongibacter sp. NS-SX5 TaxID=3463854 RepID=UPI00405A0110